MTPLEEEILKAAAALGETRRQQEHVSASASRHYGRAMALDSLAETFEQQLQVLKDLACQHTSSTAIFHNVVQEFLADASTVAERLLAIATEFEVSPTWVLRWANGSQRPDRRIQVQVQQWISQYKPALGQ